MKLIRFQVAQVDEDSRQPLGVFQAAADLRDAGQLSLAEEAWLKDVWSWFRSKLDAPGRWRRSGRAASRATAVCWMKCSATEHVAKLRELAHLLEAHEVPVQELMTTRPGYIVWEDDHQVAAVPFKPARR
jgi:hypothetical protein